MSGECVSTPVALVPREQTNGTKIPVCVSHIRQISGNIDGMPLHCSALFNAECIIGQLPILENCRKSADELMTCGHCKEPEAADQRTDSNKNRTQLILLVQDVHFYTNKIILFLFLLVCRKVCILK